MPESEQTIIQLDKKTINKIAAGEVVERPASVVKELVENSLDAKATEISVFIKGHGLDEIKIVDNGLGMSKEDAAIAWKSHTTSKLKTVEDLDAISSLGFRGEALASIASVSTMEILTKKKGQETGIFVRIKGGDLELFEERECSLGTSISVKNLFFNVPARKKFLKTKTTELGHIIEIVTRQAMIRPNLHFKLLHEKSVLLNSPKSKNSLEPFISVFGVEMAKQMIPINFEKDDIAITGFTSSPALSRSTRDYEMLYVNKRYVKSKLLSEAIEEAYKTLLMKNRYPVTLLNIKLPSLEIDVNIHPTKREVRFNNAKGIFEVVREAIADSLSSSELWREDKTLLKKSSEKISKQS
ncbi:MAG: DNA mismatch repair endonuclease MutL, partial [Candidatus Heimdallarchaeota archaeon]|nr:DNA mismatch repair endonuclease MutL [Candidatus Heimdallarchaeota archaeon]